jgi:hypothetical protein
MWDLWWKMWHCGKFPPSTSVSPADFHSKNCSRAATLRALLACQEDSVSSYLMNKTKVHCPWLTAGIKLKGRLVSLQSLSSVPEGCQWWAGPPECFNSNERTGQEVAWTQWRGETPPPARNRAPIFRWAWTQPSHYTGLDPRFSYAECLYKFFRILKQMYENCSKTFVSICTPVLYLLWNK